jgi:hypothetical protein
VAHEARALAAREVPGEKALCQAAAILLSREGVLEKLFAGEELEIRGVDPALANALIGRPFNMIEQQQPDHKPGLDPGPAVLAVERRDRAVIQS